MAALPVIVGAIIRLLAALGVTVFGFELLRTGAVTSTAVATKKAADAAGDGAVATGDTFKIGGPVVIVGIAAVVVLTLLRR